MAMKGDIRSGMQVIGSDGGMVGRVTGLHGDHIHVEPDAPEPGPGYFVVPQAWITRIDEHVHLNREAALVRDTWRREDPAAAETASANGDRGAMEPPRRGSRSVWALGIVLLLLALYLGLRGCDHAHREPDYENRAAGT